MRGTIVEESLKDSRFINALDVQSVSITNSDNPKERWHLYRIDIDESKIEELSKQLKEQKWYAHFWDNQNIIVVYPSKTFKISRTDKSTWTPAIEYGKTLSIPAEQLDFLVDED